MSMKSKLAQIKGRHEELSALMATGNLNGEEFTKLSVEYAELSPIVEIYDEYDSPYKKKKTCKPY